MGEYLESSLLPRLDFDIWQIQECFTKHSYSFPLIFLAPPVILFPHSLYMRSLFGGWVVRSRGGNSILTNLTQFVERLARGRVQPVKHWPLASGWEMGYGAGFGWGLIWISPFGDIRCGTWYFWWTVLIKQMCKWPKIRLIDSFFGARTNLQALRPKSHTYILYLVFFPWKKYPDVAIWPQLYFILNTWGWQRLNRK